MKYFIITLTYLVPMEKVSAVVTEHRAYLDHGYSQGWFLASGPQNPKTGGVIIARAPGRDYIDRLLEKDPFKLKGIASYGVIEFEPVKRHPEMGSFFAA